MYQSFRAEFPDRCAYGDAIEINDRIVRMGRGLYRHEDCEAARTASYPDAKPRAAYFVGPSAAQQLSRTPLADGAAAGLASLKARRRRWR